MNNLSKQIFPRNKKIHRLEDWVEGKATKLLILVVLFWGYHLIRAYNSIGGGQ